MDPWLSMTFALHDDDFSRLAKSEQRLREERVLQDHPDVDCIATATGGQGFEA